MSHTPHELHEEFPDKADAIHNLKQNDGHFAKLADKYHTVNREVHRVEAGVEAASDERLEELKKQRLQMLDEISSMLGRTQAT